MTLDGPAHPAPRALMTEDQRFSAEFPGSVAIDAGAGSGKTFVLIRRLLHLIRGGLKPEELVAVTFTEAAAAELRGRLQALLEQEGRSAPELLTVAERLPLAQISTIHALCARIVRDHPVESGAGLRFEVLDEAQATVWLDEALPGVLGALPEEAFGPLPAARALEAVRLMLRDPHLTEAALEVSRSSLEQNLLDLEWTVTEGAEQNARRWDEALATLQDAACPDPGDPLERGRQAALAAGAVTGSWPTRVSAMRLALEDVRVNAGSGKVWGAANKAQVTAALRVLRDLCSPQDGLEAALWQLRAVPVLGRLYAHVQSELDRLKAEQEILTFADLERLAARALSRPEVLRYYQARWRALCVDEFQDTSPLQWQILSALSQGDVNLTVVGDEKQSIYAFRGADVRLFQQARTRIATGGGANRALSHSFRTHAALLEVLNTFFGHVMPGPAGPESTAATFRPLSAQRQEAPHPSAACELHVVNGGPKVGVALLRAAEADLIAHRIQALLGEGRTVREGDTTRALRYSDVALLLRVRTHLPLYEEALFRAGLPYSVQGGRGLLDRPEVRDLVQLLLFLALPGDDLALAAVLRSPLMGWSDAELLTLTRARSREETLWQALEASGRNCAPLPALLAARAALPASALIQLALGQSEHAVVTAAMPDGERRLANIDAFLALLHGWARQGHADVQAAATRVQDTLRLDVPVAEAGLGAEDTLKIMTVHGSKGLEFPVVIVPDLLQQGRADAPALLLDAELGLALRVPNLKSDQQPELYRRLQEVLAERRRSEAERLTYVALTRAADLLLLTATAKPSQDAEIARLAGFLPPQVVRLGYDYRRIPRPEPQRSVRNGRVHGASRADPHALPETLPVTSIGLYLSCPRAFEYRHLSGRAPFTPLWQGGVTPGPGGVSAAVIGSAVHQAIEFGWSDVKITSGFPHLRPEERQEVASLVQRLRTPAFAALPSTPPRREVPLSVPFGGLTFEGVIDADYGDWIVDYKTDRQVHPEHHAPQLALYLRATGASRASLAYLRHDLLHTLSGDELAEGLARAQTAAQGITDHDFAPRPTPAACRFCLHRGVCDRALAGTGDSP